MSKTVLLGKEKEKQLKEQQKIAKQKNKRKRKSPIRFFKDVFVELKKVTWPTRKDLISYSVAVLVFIVIMALVAGLFDFGLGQLFRMLVGQSAS